MKDINDREEARYLLRKILQKEEDKLATSHLWVWEVERWKELVLALLKHVGPVPEDTMRDAIDSMTNLDLLDISSLASLQRAGTNIDVTQPLARHILEHLEDSGFDYEKAKQGLSSICEAALGLEEHYNGKVQHYLRHYGEMMLRETSQFFQFSALDNAAVENVFIYWLQGVLNMPLSLFDEHVRKFCEQHNLEPTQLIAAADDLNMNLALMDDLVKCHLTHQVHEVNQQSQSDKKL